MAKPFDQVLKFDKIGYWSEIKLAIIRRYAKEYTKILSHQGWPYSCYIDGFAGSGGNISRASGEFVDGSASIALDIDPSFNEHFFIEINKNKINSLRELRKEHQSSKIQIINKDCNEALLKDVFPIIRSKNYYRGLCLLDPYGLDLNWEVIKEAGNSKQIEIFLTSLSWL